MDSTLSLGLLIVNIFQTHHIHLNTHTLHIQVRACPLLFISCLFVFISIAFSRPSSSLKKKKRNWMKNKVVQQFATISSRTYTHITPNTKWNERPWFSHWNPFLASTIVGRLLFLLYYGMQHACTLCSLLHTQGSPAIGTEQEWEGKNEVILECSLSF